MKVLKSRIFIFVLGFVFATTIGVVAANLNANTISFEPTDENWNVTTVQAALNDLYEEKEKNCVTGSFTCTTCSTSAGQDTGVDFEPSLFWFYGRTSGNENTTWYYVKSVSTSTIISTNNSGSTSMTLTNRFGYNSNNHLIMHDLPSLWNNRTITYIACR